MFRTKKDVDRHSQEVLKKLTNEKERNLRCLSIAQQYYNIRDYESAKRYVLMYLSAKDDSSLAHKLLGQCYEQFNDKPKAIQEFVLSLQLDTKQPELILKICELLADDESVTDKSLMKQMYESGEKQYPYHPTILKLKKKLLLTDDSNYTTLEASLNDDVKSKPNDPAVHTQLIGFYIDNGRIKEAYEEAFRKPRLFTPTLQWYQCAVKICKMYKMQYPGALQEDFYANSLLSLERLLAFSVQDVKVSRKTITECVSFLSRFDETLSDAVLLANKSSKFQRIINHMCGQLCFHTANILYRKLKWEDGSSQEFNQLISPLLLLSTSKEFQIVEDRNTNDSLFRTYNICALQNAYRILQTEFVLHEMANGNAKQFIEKIFHLCVGDFWKQRIIEKVFSTSDYKQFRKSCFFVTYSAFSNLPSTLSSQSLDNIERNINIIETVNPVSLHHFVWLGVNCLNLNDKQSLCDMSLPYQFYTRKLTVLPFFSASCSSTYAESLCRLDVDAFLYASVFCAKSCIEQQTNSNKYQIFPADVSKPMCSEDQEQWWEYAYQMNSKTIPESGISRSRSILQRGIEAVRLSGNGALPLSVLVLLARTFSNRAAVEPDSEKASALEERAALYWKAALPMLESVAKNETVANPPKSFFQYHRYAISKAEALKLINEGKRIVGMQLIKENDYSDSVCEEINESYGDLNTSVASSAAAASPLWVDRIIQTVTEQNAKTSDELEKLFNKLELLYSSQFQLTQKVATLADRVEDLAVSSKTHSSDSQTSFTPNSSARIPPSAPVGFPLSWPAGSVPSATSVPQAALPTYPMQLPYANYGLPMVDSHELAMQRREALEKISFNTIPAFRGQTVGSVSGSISSKLDSSYGAVSSYLPASPAQQQASVPVAPSFVTPTSSQPLQLTPQRQQLAPVTVLQETSGAKSAPASANQAFSTGTPLNTSGFSTPESGRKTSSANTPSSVGATKQTAFHSFHIPLPEMSPLLQTPPVQVPEQDEDDDEPATEHDPLPDFKPIIPLPDEVDVMTGEEGEEVVYENRVKLFRFVDKEWKERGLGVYKLLKNPQTGRIRALMRREMVLKVCANHMLNEDMELSKMKSSDRAWIYCAPDYADERVKLEQFCIKFKTPDEAEKFRVIFERCRTESAKAATPAGTPSKASNTPTITPSKTPTSATKVTPAPPKLTPKTEKPIVEPARVNVPVANPIPAVTAADSNQTKSPFASFGGFTSLPKPKTNFSSLFQTPVVKAEPETKDKPEEGPFSAVKNTVDFSQLISQSSNAFVKNKDFRFEGAGSKVFGSSNTSSNSTSPFVAAILSNVPPKEASTQSPKSSVNSTSGSIAGDDSLNNSAATTTGEAGDEEEFVPTQEFTPVIQLPEIQEMKTGEEGMTVLFEDRCKLFRYVGKEWKERGVGNMKILKDPKAGDFRLLMRREQVHKLCCNHRLLKEHELKPMMSSDKAWTWCAQDFSENELRDETFCIKFKTTEQAKAFKIAFDDAKMKLESSPKKASNSGSDATQGTSALPKLSELFKPASDSWECKSCYVRNKASDDVCPACASPRNADEKKPTAVDTFVDNKSSFGKLSSSTTQFSFGIPKSEDGCNAFTFGNASSTTAASVKTESTFSFGSGNVTSSTVSSTSTTSTFSFGSTSAAPLFSFGNLSAPAVAPVQSKDSKFTFTPVVSQPTSTQAPQTFAPIAPQTGNANPVFSFGTTATPALFKTNDAAKSADSTTDGQKPSFNFSSAGKSQENASIFGGLKSDSMFSFGRSLDTSANSSVFGTPESTKSENKSEAFNSFSFKLPGSDKSDKQDSISFYERAPLLVNDKNEVKIMKWRITLYRRAENEEEEREVARGNLYVLKNPETGRFRLLMMEKPGLVARLSHFIDEKIVLEKSSDNSWRWFASDFSRAEVIDCVVRAVFDDVEAAEEFKRVFDQVQSHLKDSRGDSGGSSEIEFVCETKVTEEEKKLAESLRLPSNFHAYKYRSDCPGCVGCDEDDAKSKKGNKENCKLNKKSVTFFKPEGVLEDLTNRDNKVGELNAKNVFEEKAKNIGSPLATAEDASDDGDDSVVKNDHDPHFDPIIPLPDVVEARTGEENEEIKFCERSKLYRWCEKEWKERGVGELKVLYHPVDRTYRLLMRRDQVHKVVLNQRVTKDLSLQPLSSSTNSYCWFGMNLPEGEKEPVCEKLAVKFKTEAICNKFFETVQESIFEINTVRNDPSSEKETIHNVSGAGSEEEDDHDYEDGHYDDTAYEEYDHEYEDEEDEYDAEDYVDEQAIGEAMEELDIKEVLFQQDVHLEAVEGEDTADYEGVVKLARRYGEEEYDVGCIVFSTPDVPALYRADIVEGMKVINEGEGAVSFLEWNTDSFEKKMTFRFGDEESAEEFTNSFKTLNPA